MRRCRVAWLWPCVVSSATTSLTCSAQSLCTTSSASGVSTTSRSLVPERHHRTAGRMDEGVGRAHREALAADAVAVGIGVVEVGHCVPAAHVAPPALERDDRDTVAFLEHRVVDALAAAAPEGRAVHAHEIAVGFDRSGGQPAAFQDVRGMLLQRRDQHLGLDQQDARVPEIAAFEQQLFGAFRCRLLDEGGDRMAGVRRPARASSVCALADVAVGRARETSVRRRRSRGSRPVRPGCPSGSWRRSVRRPGCGDRQARTAAVVPGRPAAPSPPSPRRCCAPPARATACRSPVPRRSPSWTRNRCSSAATQVTSGLSRRRRSSVSSNRLLLPDQRRELLGQRLARQRPEPGAAAAAQDDRLDREVTASPRR